MVATQSSRVEPTIVTSKKAKTEDANVDCGNQIWEDMSPWAWRESIYTPEAADNCMGKLFRDEVALFETLAFANPGSSTIVEVGCGTAELFSVLAKTGDYAQLVGVEISKSMVECAYKQHPHLRDATRGVQLLVGNAVHLGSVLEEAKVSLGANPIVCIVMNTYGILPEHVRALALAEMWKLVAKGGTLVLGCWAKDALRVGFEDYYSRYPKLCGPCTAADFDFASGDFRCKASGYSSHWWAEEQLSADLEAAAPFDVSIKFVRHGVGLFALGKRKQMTKSEHSFAELP
jgi:SAM-dependent methyltransferase